VGARGVLFDLFPEEVVALELLESWVVLFEQVGVIWELIFWEEHFDEALVGLSLFLDDSLPL
jgi:hypothetical protein